MSLCHLGLFGVKKVGGGVGLVRVGSRFQCCTSVKDSKENILLVTEKGQRERMGAKENKYTLVARR